MAMYKEGEIIANCETQQSNLPIFAAPPENPNAAPPAEGTHSIQVGYKSLVPRWDIHVESPCLLKYYVRAETFKNSTDLELTRDLLHDSAKLWNDVGCGVTFDSAAELHQAHFAVEYSTAKKPGVAAKSFFPSHVDKFYIYSDAFNDPETRAQLVNSFTHEFGHILGLRHEDTQYDSAAATQLGEANPDSIMGYSRETRKLQPSDEAGLKKFYELENGAKLGSYPITDYPPKLLG